MKTECWAITFGETKEEDGVVKTIKPIGKRPVFGTTGAACADICTPYEVTVPPHTTMKIDTWIGFSIPEGYKVIMYPRSSLLVKRGLMQPTSIIDRDYTGHVHVPVHNLTDEPVVLEAGERIAQVECVPAMQHKLGVNWQVKNVARDQEGFGGTGRI